MACRPGVGRRRSTVMVAPDVTPAAASACARVRPAVPVEVAPWTGRPSDDDAGVVVVRPERAGLGDVDLDDDIRQRVPVRVVQRERRRCTGPPPSAPLSTPLLVRRRRRAAAACRRPGPTRLRPVGHGRPGDVLRACSSGCARRASRVAADPGVVTTTGVRRCSRAPSRARVYPTAVRPPERWPTSCSACAPSAKVDVAAVAHERGFEVGVRPRCRRSTVMLWTYGGSPPHPAP